VRRCLEQELLASLGWQPPAAEPNAAPLVACVKKKPARYCLAACLNVVSEAAGQVRGDPDAILFGLDNCGQYAPGEGHR
jgi:hypothetical protein